MDSQSKNSTRRSSHLQVFGLEGLPMIKPGDDLGCLIISAVKQNGILVEDGDIFVVAQKVISKLEGRIVEIDKVKPSERALKIASVTGRDPRIVELVLGESKRVLKVSPQTMIVEDKRSIVNINAGLDKSNVRGENRYTLLPADPDKSARGLRLRVEKLTGRKVGVIICDTYSRPFRRGQVNFAIGLGGIEPFVDYRGERDLFGYTLQVKFTAVADELASAAELVMGQGSEAVPVAVIKGFNYLAVDESFSSYSLIISEDEDLFKNVL